MPGLAPPPGGKAWNEQAALLAHRPVTSTLRGGGRRPRRPRRRSPDGERTAPPALAPCAAPCPAPPPARPSEPDGDTSGEPARALEFARSPAGKPAACP